jgi:hypothetical protein
MSSSEHFMLSWEHVESSWEHVKSSWEHVKLSWEHLRARWEQAWSKLAYTAWKKFDDWWLGGCVGGSVAIKDQQIIYMLVYFNFCKRVGEDWVNTNLSMKFSMHQLMVSYFMARL